LLDQFGHCFHLHVEFFFMSYKNSRTPLARGFTLVELLVVIAIIGVMVGLLLPAVQAAREAARAMQCSNHQRQLGLAVHNYHSAFDRFPSGWIADAPSHEPGWGWGAAIQPFIEQQAIHDQINFSVAIEHAMHQPAREHVIATFICPSDTGQNQFMIAESAHAHHHHLHASQASNADDHTHGSGNIDDSDDVLFLMAKANYVGAFGSEEVEADPFNGNGVFYGNSKIRFRDIVDGTSSTIILGERSSELGSSIWHGVIPEAAEAEARIVGSADHVPNSPEHHFEDFSSRHPGGAYFTMGDGSVRMITQFVDLDVYRALATRHNGEVIQTNDF